MNSIKAFLVVFAVVSATTTINPKTQQALKDWSDRKLGLFMHWGIYSVWGIDASWSLEWSWMHSQNPSLTKAQMTQYRKDYWGLITSFDPVEYDPVKWAKLAKASGFKYVVLTTKHHDGFNMYPTKYTNFSVMGPDSPCQRDLYGEMVTAFRNEGIMIGAYYSKADWHSKAYWSGSFPDSRDVQYNPLVNVTLWKEFTTFVQGQIEELMQMYKPDILWFDGEWVMPSMEDIFMDEIGEMARSYNPYVIMVNRDGGVEENYLTPEQGIPNYRLSDYWESCMNMGTQWAFKPNDDYKDVGTLLNWLLQIASLGGNLLLDVGPQPNGQFPAVPASRMLGMGKWLNVNGDAIYGTQPLFPYQFTDLHTTVTGDTNYFSYYVTSKANFVFITMWMPYSGFTFDNTLTMYFRHRLANNTLTDVDLLGADQKITYSWVASQRLQFGNLPTQPPNDYGFVFKLTYQNEVIGA